MKAITILCCALLLAGSVGSQGYVPPAGFVPDAKTAVKIGEAVLEPVYGEKKVESERPFGAELEKGVWTVSGTLYCIDSAGKQTTKNCLGGVALVRIAKADGRILSMIHGK